MSSEMAPGFHILVYGVTRPDDYLVTDSAYFPVQAINRHKIEFKLTQIKVGMAALCDVVYNSCSSLKVGSLKVGSLKVHDIIKL